MTERSLREQTVRTANQIRANSTAGQSRPDPLTTGTRAGMHGFSQPSTTDEQRIRRTVYRGYDGNPITYRQSQAHPPALPLDNDDDQEYETRLPSSTRRYQAPAQRTRINVHRIPARATTLQRALTQIPLTQQRNTSLFRLHWSVYVGSAFLVMLVGWIGLSTLGNWWKTTSDDLHYGRPRTFQIDAVVGHHDSASNPSHFVAFNLNRHIEIIELSGGDTTQAHIYAGPALLGDTLDLAPVTLSFRDVTGDGKPDMIIEVGESRFVYVNDHDTFRPAKPGEVTSSL